MSSRANGQSNNNASDNSNANDSQSSGRVSNEFHDNNITDNDDNQTMSTDNYLDGEDEDNTYGGNSILVVPHAGVEYRLIPLLHLMISSCHQLDTSKHVY